MGIKSASIDKYLAFLQRNILRWDDKDKLLIMESIECVNARITEKKLQIGEEVVFIKTTGREEWNGIYTRSNAIIIPESRLAKYKGRDGLYKMITHEIYHIITRRYRNMQYAMNRLIGFYPARRSRMNIPVSLARRSLTNPDSPTEYFFYSYYRGRQVRAIPLLIVNQDASRITTIHGLMKMTKIKFILYLDHGNSIYPAKNIRLYDRRELDTVPEIVELEGAEIFDPNEIMADKFVALLENMPQNDILKNMDDILKDYSTEHVYNK